MEKYALYHQAAAISKTCTVVLASPVKPEPPDPNTIAMAKAAVEEAQKLDPSNAVLKAIDFDGSVPDWPSIHAAMNSVIAVTS